MMKRAYVNISIPRISHQPLKNLAKHKGVSMADLIPLMVRYFDKTGRDPEDLAPQDGLAKVEKIKMNVEQVKRILKAQESKLLMPMSQIIGGIEKSIANLLSAQGFSEFLTADIVCPQCGAAFDTFLYEDNQAKCQYCPLSFRIKVGQYKLILSDVIALLSEGMTRLFIDIEGLGNAPLTGRLYLDAKKSFELSIHNHDYRHTQAYG